MKREETRETGERGLRTFFHFFQYNNAVPIVLSILVLGGGSVFAATNPEAVLSQQLSVLSVDNTYIAGKDLASWSPVVSITAVTEDAENYYVAYTLSTIDVKDYVWQDIVKNNSITVSKADLGDRDLGLYVTELLNNLVQNESTYLAQVQTKEKASITQKMVATAYGGLIGKFLNDSTETLPGYEPVIPLPVAAPTDPAAPIAVVAPQPVVQQPIDQQVDTLLAQSQAAAAVAQSSEAATSTSAASIATSTLDIATSTEQATSTESGSEPTAEVPPIETSTPEAPAASSTPEVAAPVEPETASSTDPVVEVPSPASTSSEPVAVPAEQATTTAQ